MDREKPWLFAQKFVPEFYKNMGRFPTEQEIEDAELDWIDYLVEKGELLSEETAKTSYRFNERGEVIDAMIVDELQS